MIAWGAFSPAYRGLQQYPPIYTTPALKQWSDIAYLQWAALHSSPYSPPISHLRYIIVPAIFNPESQSIIAGALRNARKTLCRWPGVTFNMESTGGRAILGCPNGYGVAYLLLQHRKQLGRKRVKGVTVFEDDGVKPVPRPPSLAFWVEDSEDDWSLCGEPWLPE